LLEVLHAVHTGLDAAQHQDGVLRGRVALRLSAVLEQQGQLQGALTAAEQVRPCAAPQSA
jgi:hypothetical protein